MEWKVSAEQEENTDCLHKGLLYVRWKDFKSTTVPLISSGWPKTPPGLHTFYGDVHVTHTHIVKNEERGLTEPSCLNS